MSDNEKENTANNDIQQDIPPDATDTDTADTADTDTKNTESKKKSITREIISWAMTIIGAVILAYIITTFVIVNAEVPSESMEDTIKAGDRLVAFRLSYLFDDPERYDIVVFKYPDDEDILFIKRIIGLPGEKVTIKRDENGETKIYINDNDTPLEDSFIREPMILRDENSSNEELTYIVPENCYFMLGDNRNNSRDSRFWENTFVEKDKILGKALFKYYPSIEWIGDIDNS